MKNNRPIEVGQVRQIDNGSFYVIVSKVGVGAVQVLMLTGESKGDKAVWDEDYIHEDIVIM